MTASRAKALPAGALEVFQHRLASVAEGMGATLRRSAFSPNIKERLDFSCAVFDATGRLLAQAAHIPVHLGAMPASVEAARAARGIWSPGDVVLLNDPMQGGSHLPDLTTVSPVFAEGGTAPAFFLATRAHHADVGGQSPGSMPLARDLFGEGLVIPPVRLQREGQIDADLLAMICANSRSPDERRGDLEAQLATHRHGESRMRALAARGGVPAEQLGVALLDQSRRLARACLRELPSGSYSAEDQMDGDGFGPRRYPIVVRLDLDDGKVRANFAGSAPAAPTGINAPLAVTRSAVYYVIACLLGDTPINAGSLSNIAVEVPPGSLLDPPAGAAVAAGNVETSQRVVDVVLRALAGAAPERMPASSQGTMNNLTIGGLNPRQEMGDPPGRFTYYETLPGGAGGGPNVPGASGIQVHMTNTLSTPIEALETAYPIRVEAWRLRRGSGGAGARPGGDGIVRRLRMLVDVQVGLMSERRDQGPPGLAGGAAGSPGINLRIDAGGVAHALPAKGSFDLFAGEAIEVHSPGGGGWGSPAPPQPSP